MFTYGNRRVIDRDVPPEGTMCAFDEAGGVEVYQAYFDKDDGFVFRYRSGIVTFDFLLDGSETMLNWVTNISVAQSVPARDVRREVEQGISEAAVAMSGWPYRRIASTVSVALAIRACVTTFLSRAVP